MIVAEDRDLSIEQAAKRLGVHPNTIRNNIQSGEIRARKVLGRWRIKESEVDRIMRGSSADFDQDRRDE